ncbi:MAG: PP2C family protein-serine/threonine phosphatase, partial [Bacteroidota bacterium]
LSRELSLARAVQQRLLPTTLPEIPGLRLSAIEKPAQTVGGDYYDAVSLGDDCVGVVVADVSGKGAGAAFYMAEMKGIFQAASRLTRSPSEFLCRANEALSPSLERGTFVSAIYGVIDGQTGTLALARAGHCPALLIHPTSGAAASGDACAEDVAASDSPPPEARTRYLRPDGLALGLDPGPLFQRTLDETLVHLVPGDVAVLFTDGLVEARDASGETYGYDRLAAAAAHLCPTDGACDPHALRDALLDDVAQFTGLPETDDDVTLMVVAWGGPPDS